MRRRTLSLVPVAIAGVVIAGCASSDDPLDHTTAATLQSGVAQVAQYASAGDTAAALASLDELQASLDAAESAGTIAADRAQLVQQNIDVVRADLQPTGEATVPETTVTDPTPAPAEETETATTPAEDTETPPADDSSGKGPGGDKPNKGPGNNNGNGNGNGGGPGKK